MLEATLFGYEKGAFTGAVQACPGKFEQAQGGTILLDEISEMDLNLQAKLLRVLQEREVERLGSRKSIKLDVRVLATSNRDLKQYVQEGNFREDLYYRLNVFPISWPALKDRKADIEPLANHLVERNCKKLGMPVPNLSTSAVTKLHAYSWPGNVRELDNVVQRALILSENGHIDQEHILLEGLDWQDASSLQKLVEGGETVATPDIKPVAQVDVAKISNSSAGLGGELRDQEFAIIMETLIECNGRRKEMAEKLGISPRTLRYKLAKMRDAGMDIPG
jgi:two-component system response regulator FlrC